MPDAADETRSRALLLFPYAAADATVAALRAAKAQADGIFAEEIVAVRVLAGVATSAAVA